MQKLTTGALMRFAKNSSAGEQPILQVLNVKLMDSKQVTETNTTASQYKRAQRYRLILSDGKHFLPSCVLTVQLNDLVTSGQLQEYSIIRLDRYLRSDLKGQATKMILQVLQVTILDIATHRIGNPVSLLTADLNETEQSDSSTTRGILQPKVSELNTKRSSTLIMNDRLNIPTTISIPTKIEENSLNNNRLFKIDSLNPFQNRWTIRVRVSHKNPVRSFSNGEGKLFSCDLIDETGEIRATGFGDDCDRLEPLLITGNVYFITRAQIKYANKQYNNLNNEFEMTFNNETIIESCSELIATIPNQHLNFVPIAQIPNKEINSYIDVIGVVLNIQDVIHGKTKQNKDYTKRDIMIRDRTSQITVTLWYQTAIDFPISCVRAVIVLKGACVNDFNGNRNLSALASTQVQIDPEISDAHELRRWYLQEGMNIEMTDLTNLIHQEEHVSWKTFQQLNQYESISRDNQQGELVRVKGVCTYTRQDPVYKACYRADCKKKLQDNNDGTYYCSKCDLNYENYRLMYMASILLSDSTGSQWVSFFDKQCENLFACPPEQFPYGKTKDIEDQAYRKLMTIFGIEKIFLIRIKINRYNNQDRIQMTCVGIEPADPKLITQFYFEDISRLCTNTTN